MPAMSKKDQEERLEAIAALLRKAEDPGATPEESQSFTDGALRLAKKYEIDLTLAREMARGTVTRQRAEQKDKHEITLRRPKIQQAMLAGQCFRFTGCMLLRWGKGNQLKLVAFGYESDLAGGQVLFDSLVTQAALQCATRYRQHREHAIMMGRKPEVERTFRRGFYNAFSRLIGQRFTAITTEVVDVAEPGTAVALRTKEDEIKAWVEQMFGETKSGRRIRGSKAMAGWIAGEQAGREADLGTTRRVPAAKRGELG
jgi:hypothetical protein